MYSLYLIIQFQVFPLYALSSLKLYHLEEGESWFHKCINLYNIFLMIQVLLLLLLHRSMIFLSAHYLGLGYISKRIGTLDSINESLKFFLYYINITSPHLSLSLHQYREGILLTINTSPITIISPDYLVYTFIIAMKT